MGDRPLDDLLLRRLVLRLESRLYRLQPMYIPINSLPGPLDVSLYLKRIGAVQVGLPPALHLDHLHQRHLLSIPFETLDAAAGLVTTLELPELFEKIVRRRRGGDSFELGLLFAWMLRELGFTVGYRLGSVVVNGEEPSDAAVMLLVVDLDDQQWLLDIACNTGLVTPVPFRPGGTAITREGEIRIDAAEAGVLVVCQMRAGQIRRTIRILTQPVDEAACSSARLQSTTSIRQQGLQAAIMTESGFARLSHGRLFLPRQNHEPDSKALSAEQIPYFLEHLFEIETPEAEWGKRGN